MRNSGISKQRNLQTSHFVYNFASLLAKEQDKAREVIRRAVDQERHMLEKEKFDEFCKKLFEIYEREEQRKDNIVKRDAEFLISSLNSKFPVRDAMKTYIAYQMGFDDEHLAASVEHLSKLFKAFSDKPSYYTDLSQPELLENWRFTDMLGDIKYMMLKGNSVSFSSLVKVSEALAKIGYRDPEIHSLFLQKLNRLWKNKDDGFEVNLEDLHENPQYGKKGYYAKGGNEISLKNLLENPEFKSYIDTILSNKESEVEITSTKEQKEIQEITYLLEKLSSTIKKHDEAHKKLGQSIIAIRDQFTTLNQAQKEAFLVDNIFLRSELLELEEFLLDAGLLSLKDVFDPKNITDQQLKVENAANILTNLLLEQKETTLDATLSRFVESTGKINKAESSRTQQTASTEDLAFSFDKHPFSKCLAALTELACSTQGLSKEDKFINAKWKELLPNPKLEEFYDKETNFKFNFEFCKLSNIYSEIWQATSDYLKASFLNLQEQLSKELPSTKSIETGINLAYSYSKIHLSAPTKAFLQSFQANETFFAEISKKTFVRLLRTLNYISNIDKKSFFPVIQKYISSKVNDFSADEALEALHFLVVHNLYEAKDFTKLLKTVNTIEIDNVLTEIDSYQQELLTDLNIFFSLKYPNSGLTHHLQLFLRTQNLDKPEGKQLKVIDPLKELIGHGIKKSVSSKFSNLLPGSVKKLTKEYQPTAFYRNQDGKVGIFVGDGSMISIDENELSSTHQFRFQMLENLYPDIHCRGVSYHQFLDIDFRNAQLSFKSNNYLETVLEEINTQNKPINALKQICFMLVNDYNAFLQATPRPLSNNDFEFFFEQLDQFFVTEKEYNSVLEPEQRLNYSDKLKHRLAYLNSAFLKTNEETKNKINQVTQKQSGKDFLNLIHAIKETLTFKGTPQKQEIITPKWAGLIYGEQIPVASATTSRKNIDKEILNYTFIWDADYHNYNDWRDHLESNLNKNNVDFTNLEGTKNFHGDKRVPTGLIPNGQRLRNSIQPLSFPWNWEALNYKMPVDYFKKFLASEIDNLVFQKPLREEYNLIANLQNLKVEWKATLNESQISNKLIELDFIEELMQEHLGHQPKTPYETFSVLCNRNPEDYMSYLEKLSRGWLVKDHYANFFFDEGFKKAETHSIKEEYERKSQALYEDHKNGIISLDTYNAAQADLRRGYINKLKVLVSENNVEDEVLKNNVKSYNFQMDFKALSKQTDIENLYDFKKDPDFRRSNRNLQDMLNLKRRKAETKLIKLRIIKKLHEEKSLSAIEAEYLKQWKKSLEESPLVDLDLNMVPENYTKRSMGSLSEKDRNNFDKLDFFEINSLSTLGLTDLILEVALFFDDATIKRLEAQLKGNQISKEWGISSDYKFDLVENTEVRLILDSIEENIWRQSGKFTDEEVESIQEMYGVLRGNTKIDREWLRVDRESLNEFIGTINQYEDRAKFLEEWFEKKEKELSFKNYINIPPQFIQTDNFYRKIFQPRLEKKIRTSVEEIFHKQYEKIEKAELHIFVENIIERLYLLKKYFPKKLHFVLKGVLNHPNISILDKNNLQSVLNMQKVTLQITDSKLLVLNDVEIKGERLSQDKEFSNDQIRNNLQNAKTPFIQDLSKKFQSL